MHWRTPDSSSSRVSRLPGRVGLQRLLLLALLVTGGGCRTMTRAKEMQIEKESREQTQASAVEEEAQKELDKVAEAQKALRRKALQIQARQEREEKRRKAAQLLASDPEAALALAQEILDAPVDEGSAPPASEETGDTNMELEVLPPPLEPQEEARLLVIKGSALYRLDRPNEAIAAYEDASELDSSMRIARRNFGKLLFQQGKYQKAVDVWKLELADGYRDADLLYLYAQALYEVGRQEQKPGLKEAARVTMRDVMVERPEDDEVRRWLAILEFETGRYAEAARLFRAILEDKPLDPEYLELLANAYLQLDDYDRALDVLELAAGVRGENDPSLLAIYRTLGDLYAVQNLPGKAAEWLSRSYGGDAARAPNKDRFQIGMLFAEAEREEEAVHWLESVEEGDVGYADAQARLAYIYRSRDQKEEALGAYQKIRRVRPQDGHAHLAVGDIFLERKRLDDARDAYAQAAALQTTRGEGLAGLAEVAYAQRDLEQAIKYYEQAIKAQPDQARFRLAMREIQTELRIQKESETARRSMTS